VASGLARHTRGLRRALRRYPRAEAALRAAAVHGWRFRLRLQARGHVDAPDRLLVVPTRAIDRALWLERNPAFAGMTDRRHHLGSVIDRDWDREVYAVAELDVVRAIEDHVERGTPWADTKLHRELSAAVERGDVLYACRTRDDVAERFRRLDELRARIAGEGFRSQRELADGRPWDEVLVAIDRDGRFLLADGRHRLALARSLGVDMIPVLVLARHSSWVAFTKELRANVAAPDRGGRAYQPVLHPDLADIPSLHGHDRYEMIRAGLPVDGGTLLDIGANWGYFSQRFADAGFDCWAVERAEREFYFLDRLRRANGNRFRAVKGSLFEVDIPHTFDVVLALNIFHHFLKRRDSYDALCAFLDRIQFRHMVFQPHLAHEAQMADAYRNFTPAEFVEFVATRTGHQDVRELGTPSDGRTVFLLS
jgi:hypothetical protein